MPAPFILWDPGLRRDDGRPSPAGIPAFAGMTDRPRPCLPSPAALPLRQEEKAMRIACLGGGPAGLYFAISMKLREPAHEIDLFERNRPGDTFGWGVVFSDQTVENLMANDPVSGAVIRDEFAHWDDIDVHIHGSPIRSSGHGFIGIGRKRLLFILQQRARDLGVRLHFEHEASADLADWSGYDLVIAADGANSRIRNAYEEHFGVDMQVRRNRFFWFGTGKVFEAFTFA